MSPAGPSLRRTGAVVVTLLLRLVAVPSPTAQGQPAAADTGIRALWVLRTSLVSPESITTLVRSAKDNGFNTLLVQVRSRGDAYYESTLEPRAVDLVRTPTRFDP